MRALRILLGETLADLREELRLWWGQRRYDMAAWVYGEPMVAKSLYTSVCNQSWATELDLRRQLWEARERAYDCQVAARGAAAAELAGAHECMRLVQCGEINEALRRWREVRLEDRG